MLRLLVAVMAVGIFSGMTVCQDKPAPNPSHADLVSKLKAGEKDIDFKQLRLAYAEAKGGRDTTEQKKAMNVALNSKKYEDAIKNADKVLAQDYADMDAHFAEYIAHRELHQSDQAEFHKLVLRVFWTPLPIPATARLSRRRFRSLRYMKSMFCFGSWA